MIRKQYPFFYKRYAYDVQNNILHDLKNETESCIIDKIDLEQIEPYSSLNEAALMLDHPNYKTCPYCMKTLIK